MIAFKTWHSLLDMEQKDEAWHIEDVADEMVELSEASGFIDRWSEYSDVVYTVTRARRGGYELKSPLKRRQFLYGSIYMFPKYSSRWLFFNRAGRKLGAKRKVTEVRNPQKLRKLEHIANKYGLEPQEFITVCQNN